MQATSGSKIDLVASPGTSLCLFFNPCPICICGHCPKEQEQQRCNEHVAVIDHLYAIHFPFQHRTAMPNDGSRVPHSAPSKQHRPYPRVGRLGQMIATKKAVIPILNSHPPHCLHARPAPEAQYLPFRVFAYQRQLRLCRTPDGEIQCDLTAGCF